jgi:hypothetical protein
MLTTKKCNHHHLVRQFNKEFYNFIQAFQGQRMINTPKDVKDIHSKGNVIYMPTNARLDPKKKLHLKHIWCKSF